MGPQGPEERRVIPLSEVLIENHPKFIDRWAKRFLFIYRQTSKDNAIQWAKEFLNPDAIKPVAERASILLKGRGK